MIEPSICAFGTPASQTISSSFLQAGLKDCLELYFQEQWDSPIVSPEVYSILPKELADSARTYQVQYQEPGPPTKKVVIISFWENFTNPLTYRDLLNSFINDVDEFEFFIRYHSHREGGKPEVRNNGAFWRELMQRLYQQGRPIELTSLLKRPQLYDTEFLFLTDPWFWSGESLKWDLLLKGAVFRNPKMNLENPTKLDFLPTCSIQVGGYQQHLDFSNADLSLVQQSLRDNPFCMDKAYHLFDYLVQKKRAS